MQKLFFILIGLSAFVYAESIKIDLEAINRLSTPPRDKPKPTVVTEVIPVATPKVKYDTSFMPAAIPPRKDDGMLTPREEARENFIRSLRLVIEKGKDFKYYFPNYDYGESKKDIEQMMKDAVSQ